MKFISIAFVAVIFCAVAAAVSPPSSNSEFQLNDVETFDLVDDAAKVIKDYIEKVKCALNAITELIVNGELKTDFEKLRLAVEEILENDMKECAQAEGLLEKFKCTLGVSQRLAQLFKDFLKKALVTDKELSQKIIAAIKQCSQKENIAFELDDERFLVDDEFTFGLIGTITKKLQQLMSKIKCSVRVAGETIGNGDLKNVFVQFRNDVYALLQNDARECIKAKGPKAKIECTFFLVMKFNKLYKDFIQNVIQTNKDTAALIVLEIKSQCFDSKLTVDGDNSLRYIL